MSAFFGGRDAAHAARRGKRLAGRKAVKETGSELIAAGEAIGLAVTAERLFSKVIKLFVPEPYYWPGLGLLIGLLVLYFVGLAVNAYFVGRALRMSDALFARIPVVKTIYLAIRDFMSELRESGVQTGGPSAFGPKNGSSLRWVAACGPSYRSSRMASQPPNTVWPFATAGEPLM